MADALHDAAISGDLARLRAVLATGVDVDATRGGCGLTSLHVAALHSRTACLEALLAAGASVHSEGSFGMTPLYVTIWNSKSCGRASRVRALIAAGSDLESASHFGSTPFTCALSLGKRRVLKILLRAGAHVNTANLRRNGLQYPDKFDSWKLVDAVRKAEGWANYVARRRAIGAGVVSKATKGVLPEAINVEILAFVEPPGGY